MGWNHLYWAVQRCVPDELNAEGSRSAVGLLAAVSGSDDGKMEFIAAPSVANIRSAK